MIVVGGEALVDLVPAAPAAEGERAPLLPSLGGGPYNTAIALGRLGADVAFLSRVSTDGFGDALMARLRGSGVRTDLVQRGPQPTTLAVVALAADGSAGYTFYVEGTADRMVADPGPLPDDVTAVSLGTLSLVLEPGASAYEKVLRREAARGRLTVLDPNIRTGLIEDADAYRERFTGWLPDVGVLKVSEEDARWLAGDTECDTEGDIEPVVRGWLRAGVGAVVLTRGADGLVAFTDAVGRVDVPSAEAEVVDTIGAGDTVHAALLHRLHEYGSRIRDLPAGEWISTLQFAAAAAAITVSRVGAEPPYYSELEKA